MRHFRRLAALLLALTLTLSLAAPAASAASGGFTDVPAKHWAAAEIRRSAQAGLIRGETATRFGLGHPMTRGAFVSVLCRFFQWPLVDHDGSFTDVPKTLWCRQAIETALVHGAVTTQTDAFRPDDPITREEMAVMLVRALGYGPISGLDLGIDCPFTDVRTNQGYLALAYHLGIVNGTSATAFSPDRSATREQAVVMLTRLYDRYFAAAPAKIGFVSDVAKNISWTGFTDLILSGGRLSASGVMTAPKGTDDFLVQCRLQGSRALLGVTVDAAALSGDPTLQASRVLSAADGFGGVALSVSGMTAKQREGLTALAAALRASLGEDRLLLTVDADGGYDLAALAAQCDGLLLATTPDPVTKNGIRVAPLEPPRGDRPVSRRRSRRRPGQADPDPQHHRRRPHRGGGPGPGRQKPGLLLRPLRPELPPPQRRQRRLVPRRGLHPGAGPALPPLRHRHRGPQRPLRPQRGQRDLEGHPVTEKGKSAVRKDGALFVWREGIGIGLRGDGRRGTARRT